MALLYTYNASYAIYEIRDAVSLELLTTTVFESEAQTACATGTLPAWCSDQPIH